MGGTDDGSRPEVRGFRNFEPRPSAFGPGQSRTARFTLPTPAWEQACNSQALPEKLNVSVLCRSSIGRAGGRKSLSTLDSQDSC